ncbi:helix-turn-helix transcriptional regulator [Herbaspirillum rhizosphaerae]|uniref:helix-turn-helix transcriptional regulator n=1 Tax=Herbaspirillum rhizosphaerae TaxID=346179 RepID=UPI00067D378C|nr:AraC family transcriptional regulator [Herbaspirillum rhizosphaerae]
MDMLSEFFERIHLRGQLFYAGKVDGTLTLDRAPGTAFIHILEEGGIDLVRRGMPTIPVHQPSLLLCPSTCRYQLRANRREGARLICGSFEFGASMGSTFPLGVTETMIFPFDQLGPVQAIVSTLIAEFGSGAPGRNKALNVLFEYILILLIRKAVEDEKIKGGILFAMLDGRLAEVFAAIHREPERDWTVEELAQLANMSRSAFSACFRKMLGLSPIAYVTAWRMRLAQDLLQQGVQMKVIAATIGYSSQAAFTRSFIHQFGMPPSEWLKTARE